MFFGILLSTKFPPSYAVCSYSRGNSRCETNPKSPRANISYTGKPAYGISSRTPSSCYQTSREPRYSTPRRRWFRVQNIERIRTFAIFDVRFFVSPTIPLVAFDPRLTTRDHGAQFAHNSRGPNRKADRRRLCLRALQFGMSASAPVTAAAPGDVETSEVQDESGLEPLALFPSLPSLTTFHFGDGFLYPDCSISTIQRLSIQWNPTA